MKILGYCVSVFVLISGSAYASCKNDGCVQPDVDEILAKKHSRLYDINENTKNLSHCVSVGNVSTRFDQAELGKLRSKADPKKSNKQTMQIIFNESANTCEIGNI